MPGLSIQLIVFGKRAGEDFDGVLADIRGAGYDGAEIGNPVDTTPAAQVRASFERHGLSCSGYHTGYPAFTDLELVRRTAEHMNGVGAKFLMCSGVEKNDDAEAYKRSAEVFNIAGGVLKQHGISLCYHNHHWEFFDLGGGVRGMDLLLEHTDPALVDACFDVFWLACGGVDPAEFLRQHGSRCQYFHLKDGSYDPVAQKPDEFTELGNGQVPLEAAWEVIRTRNPVWATTEQDRTTKDPAESAAISARYARQVLGI